MTRRIWRPFWRRQLLFPFLALLAVDAVVFGAYTLPRLLQERTILSRLDVLRAEVERGRRLNAALQRQADTIRGNAADFDRFFKEVVGTRGATLVPVLQEIAEAARETGVRGGRESYRPEEVKGAPLVQFVITMPVEGSYRELVAFLDRLERSEHFLTVDRVQLRESGAGGETSLDVALSTYFRADAEGEAGDAR